VLGKILISAFPRLPRFLLFRYRVHRFLHSHESLQLPSCFESFDTGSRATPRSALSLSHTYHFPIKKWDIGTFRRRRRLPQRTPNPGAESSPLPKSIPLEAHAPPQHIITKIPSSGDKTRVNSYIVQLFIRMASHQKSHRRQRLTNDSSLPRTAKFTLPRECDV